MRNILTAEQMRTADAATILKKGISSLLLMEHASIAFTEAFKSHVSLSSTISIYAGTGNNGGDGLAIARILHSQGYKFLRVIIAEFGSSRSPEFIENHGRLMGTGINVRILRVNDEFPPEGSEVIIDALLGSGLRGELRGPIKELVNHLHKLKRRVFAVDVPTGFPSEGVIPETKNLLPATHTLSFQRPKVNFFFPESAVATNSWEVVDIGLDENVIQQLDPRWQLIEAQDIITILKPRKSFSHKGSYGHALIVAGESETMGAALLCADACLHSGAGLTSAAIPESGLTALNSRCPEVMFTHRKTVGSRLNNYQAVVIGPGLGTGDSAQLLLAQCLDADIPLVIDADGLNIISEHPEMIDLIPSGSIICPHMKEFDRLFGKSETWWERVRKAKDFAERSGVVIVLKNRYTFIVKPEGSILINQTGNPGMAVGGMGDVLSGMLVSFRAQGYEPAEAATLAVYLHGLAGDKLSTMHSIPPRYIISILPKLIKDHLEG